MSEVSWAIRNSIRKHVLAASAGLAALFIGLGSWAGTVEFSGAIIASGSLVVESEVKKVQHPTGGIVDLLAVRNGDQVEAGQVLVRLDETVTRANLSIVRKAYEEALAKQARLLAERDGAETIAFPRELIELSPTSETRDLLTGEQKLFELRRAAREGLRSQYRERIAQLHEQVGAHIEQVAAKDRESELIELELIGVRDLEQKKLVPLTRLNALERDAMRIKGERGTLVSAIAQARGKVTEINLQILQIDQDLRTEVGKELAEVNGKISELVERRVAAEDQLKRVEIRAPQSGTVHELAVHTVGGVVSPGETLMLIVPGADRLSMRGRIAPHEIEQVFVGQRVNLRFAALNRRTTPEIAGEVFRVSPDLTLDERTGQSFYTIRVNIPEAEMARLGDAKLSPGMPVDAFVQTRSRTVISYFTKPITDHITHAFRER